ncbi:MULTISPECIES: glycerophosphodiester phosphodiesterase [unclassified Oceanispirochaeta]|uniref:glycerophosphodiester phosphodiesterase n=1 Tax=unclassified Oceanispirochaeta TaxID=2635722 RepID=UPI000E099481|nr:MULTISPECIES: glycerophosphodiester phosphodiesterase [unclassified Oceanispirochaeta]MBF9016539.1 glycerophosphodiester phosphodiesterase [Oceanispirochaeta sp. M2]NPD73001.1 glycerophosphodiester phosphodiesterase [Oceanispirochaeta sp. M1]RDG31345.1 glycerophosphodiester phosphodiesterase [Oceanispirochaeta sp. M1]
MIHTIVTLHSGALDKTPNSQEYLDLAAEMKPDVVEVDVRCTSDGIVVLHHDPDVKDTAQSLVIAENSLRELKVLSQDLLTLSEAMIFCKKHKLFMNLDLKESNAADAVIRVIKEQDMARDILFSGCGKKEILHIRKNLPEARVLLNVEDDELNCDGSQYSDAVVRNVYNASEWGCCGLNINHQYCKNELVNYARTRSLPLMIWTVDDEEKLRHFISLGVYSITTNRIDLFHMIQQEFEEKIR